ncbi:PREDICTED: uncharacterized protein LOC109240231 [Nicotiana attenuata]|uniref:uncharacterized protein LOC109240231 n=1 Tax=Nicotiana attenuata TaxID=49451 RepID=UPI00090510A8|nr:PREDICTED: uncharacterized protein LOC109240231 [Nicotiana attenuata]
MAAPPNSEEVQSTYIPPRFNGQYYKWWKKRTYDFIMTEDSELWYIICDGPFVPTKTIGDPAPIVAKTIKEYNDVDPEEIWEALQIAHEGTTQVKKSKIDVLTTEFELFRMKDDESIQDMHIRFTSIINEVHSLGEIIPRNELVRKILSVLPSSLESKVNGITEAKDLQELTIDELVGNLKTYEMKKKKDNERREPNREKHLVLKTNNNDSGGEDADMAYLTKRFQKMVRGIGAKRNEVPDKRFKRKDVADNVVKQALATWGDSSSESGEDDDQGDSSMIVVKSEATEYDSIFAIMAKIDNDNDDVNFLDVQKKNLKSYSSEKLMYLENILIDAYHSLVNDKDALTVELGEAVHWRDDLVVVVADLKETIESLKKEEDALTEKIATIKHERDDLVVKEITECVTKEKEVLTVRVADIDHERDDLIVVVVGLKETIEELKRESRPGNTQKAKEVVSETHLRLEYELKSVKSSLCAELEKNRQLQEDLGRVKSDLEKSLKWTWSSDAITAMYTNSGGNRQGIRFQREKTPYNSHCKIEKSLSHSIENVYYVNVLKYNLPSVSQICDKGNKVEFVSKICKVTNLVTREVVLVAKRYKNIYVADFETLKNGDLSYLSAVDDNAKLWHRKLGLASFALCKDETFQVFVAFVKKIQSIVPGEVIALENGKADMMSHVEESNKDGATISPINGEEPGPSVTTIESKNRVVDAIPGVQLEAQKFTSS